MKYLSHEGEQLYVPQSLEEAKLIYHRIFDLLQLGYEDWQLWELARKSSEVIEWFPASRMFPLQAEHVDNFSQRPKPPMIVTLDLALTTRFDEGVGLISRLSAKMPEETRHELDRLFVVHVSKSIFRLTNQLDAVERLVKGIKFYGKKNTEEV